ncbi:MAG: SUMF1/EgtB/PvdO family nonheme iron enzyme [Pseudomonadota bacterium]
MVILNNEPEHIIQNQNKIDDSSPQGKALQAMQRIQTTSTENFAELLKIANLDPARHLRNSDWSECDFRDVDLTGYDFSGAKVRNAKFDNAVISGAKFHNTDLTGSNIWKAKDWKEYLLKQKPQHGDLSRKPFSLFRDLPFTPEMVVIPPSTFMMGSPDGEKGRYDHEDLQHEVVISRYFAIGQFAITFDEWDHFVRETNYEHTADDEGWDRNNMPAIHVSWDDAQAYVHWLCNVTGALYRLPSELEWEYCCRAGTKSPFWCGNSISADQANYDGRYAYNNGSVKKYREKTVPVDSFDPNPWGLYNVHGNVWEWCSNLYSNTYKNASVESKIDLHHSKDTRHALRGGAWNYRPQFLRSASRFRYPTYTRLNNVGFRIARTL